MARVNRFERSVARRLEGAPRIVLAVSGGRDSMVLLDAAARAAPERIVLVGTFDHGTGAAASRASRHVLVAARARGLRVEQGTAVGLTRGNEASWRDARWRFLRQLAHDHDAVVATAHTRDDHIETVLIRVLRNAGARGLAGLHADGVVLRPLLELSRSDVARQAAVRGVPWVDDPTNEDRRHLRNRVRLDILPALERAQPGFGEELLELSQRAAGLRTSVEHVADRLDHELVDGELRIARDGLASHELSALSLLWPALAARAGVTLDRRGTDRLVRFTKYGVRGARMQVSGGHEVIRIGHTLRLRHSRRVPDYAAAWHPASALEVAGWRFSPAAREHADSWSASLPAHAKIAVRAWRPGDRMVPRGAIAPRRVKGLLRDAGIDAGRRAGWPVVLVDDRIVWIPGVRHAEPLRNPTGGSLVRVSCERVDG